MVKKILSATLVLALALSVVGTLQMTSFAADHITIDDMPGAVVYSENFDKVEDAAKTTPTQYGMTESDTAANCVSDFVVETEGDGNKALIPKSRLAYYYSTPEELAEMAASEYTISITDSKGNVKVYPAILKKVNDDYFLIYDVGGVKQWVGIDYVEGTKAYAPNASKTNNFKWFYANGNPYTYMEGADGTGVTVKNPKATASSAKIPIKNLAYEKNGTDIKGIISIGYKFKNLRAGTWAADDGATIALNLTGVLGQFYIRQKIVRIDGTHNYIYIAEDNAIDTGHGPASFIAPNADTTGIFDAKGVLKDFGDAPRDNGWHDALVVVDYDNATYRLYYDGKPVFFNVSGKYSSEFKILNKTTAPDFIFSTPRYNYWGNNEPMFDDVVVKYKATPNTVINAEVAKTQVSLANSDGKDAYMGYAITANIPEGTFNKMKWVFNTNDARYFSKNYTSNVSASGNVTFAAVFKNGAVVDGAVVGAKDIIAVDAIFDIDGVNYFTNMIDDSYLDRP